MTIFMWLSRLLDKSASELRPRSKTLLEAAEHAMPVSGDDVVDVIQDRTWQNARNDCRLPGPPKLTRDEERRFAPGECPAVIGPIVHQNVKRRQIGGVAAEMFNHRSARSALQRSEREHTAAVASEEELKQPAAQPTNAVVEHEVSTFTSGCHLRRRISHAYY